MPSDACCKGTASSVGWQFFRGSFSQLPLQLLCSSAFELNLLSLPNEKMQMPPPPPPLNYLRLVEIVLKLASAFGNLNAAALQGRLGR
jgi:hypothetical protein